MIRKSLAALVLFASALVLFPLVAGAHVEIDANGAPTNGVVTASISAENECANNGKLMSVELDFPATPELATASAAPADGWTAAVTKKAGSEAVEKVTWTNTGGVGGDGKFSLELGTIPEGQKAVNFKALDTCDDGEVTRWIEPGENGEHPAPVLALKSSGGETTTTTKPVSTKSSDDSNTGLIVGIIAAVVVVGGGGAFLLIRKKNAT